MFQDDNNISSRYQLTIVVYRQTITTLCVSYRSS